MGIEMVIDAFWRTLCTSQLLGRLTNNILHTIPHPDHPGEFSFIVATTRWEELAGLLVRLFHVCDPNHEDGDALAVFMVAAASFIGTMPNEEPIYCERFLDIIEDLLRNN